jgi:hypothetical protein
MSTISTPTSRLQTTLTSVGRSETGDLAASRANHVRPIGLERDIVLDAQLHVYSFTKLTTDTTGQERTVTWLGTEPPLVFESFDTTDQHSSSIHLDGLNIYAPNATKMWEWGASAQGNAKNYRFTNLRLTCGGSHLNFEAPGDGLMYSPIVRNVYCNGTGQTMTGNPVTGTAINLQHVSQTVSGSMIDLTFDRGSITFIGCWIEPNGAGVLGIGGEFGTVTWIGNHSEPHTTGYMVDMTGRNFLVADYLLSASPTSKVRLQNYATLAFTGPPSYTLAGGTLPDGWPVTDPLDADLGLTYKIDSTSVMRFTGGSGKLTGTI